jgi:hypothetical protein
METLILKNKHKTKPAERDLLKFIRGKILAQPCAANLIIERLFDASPNTKQTGFQ